MSIGTPIRIRNGSFDGEPVSFWAWPVDGYWDIHITDVGEQPDGSEVISEFHGSLSEARRWAREYTQLNRWINSL
jgi:hypothetical protein